MKQDGTVFDDSSILNTYVADLYWVIMTITSVGYGDITSVGISSRIFSIVVMFFSSIYAGLVVSSTSQLLKRIYDDDLDKQISEAAFFMRTRSVPSLLEKRVEHNLRQYYVQEKSLLHAPNLLARLPLGLQRQLSLALLRDVITQFPLFMKAPESFLEQVAQACSWMHAQNGDVLVEVGQLEQELIFVTTGKAVLLKSKEAEQSKSPKSPQLQRRKSFYHGLFPQAVTEQKLEEVKIGGGAWFGERCLFVQDHIRNYSVIAESPTELAILQAVSYQATLKMYPRLMTGHLRLFSAQLSGELDLADLAHKPKAQESVTSLGRRLQIPSWLRSRCNRNQEEQAW